jgi:protein phosphatase 1 regulatory subunit 7
LVTQKIQGLDALVNLEELWLGKNKIAKLEVMTDVGK